MSDTEELHKPKFEQFSSLKSEDFARVSPLAILYFFSKALYNIVSNFLIYSLPAIVATYSSLKANPHYLIIGIVFFLSLILVSAIIKYWFYFYKFSNDRVEIKQGVFNKSHLDLPFRRIQNVKIVQPFYYRFNHYSFIELDTAGSASQEAKIVAIELSLAESFKQLILEKKDHEQISSYSDNPTNIADQQTFNEAKILNTRSTSDLILHGISNNRVWIFLGFLAPFFNVISENINTVLESIGIDLTTYFDYQSQSIGLFLLHIISLVLFVMGVLVLFSIVGSIFVFHGYQLSQIGDRYIRQSGLLNKQEVSMRLSRIQVAVQQQDWLDMLLRRVNLRFEQNSSVPTSANQTGDINNASKLIVPSVTIKESASLIKNTFDVTPFSNVKFNRISKRFIARVMLVRILPILALVYTLAIANSEQTVSFYLGLSFFTLFLFLLVCLRWWRWGYFFSQDYIYIRKGFFGVNYLVFPRSKIQQTSFKQSLFMKNAGLADAQFVMASGGNTIPLIPQSTAKEQIDITLAFLAINKPAWM